MDGVQDRQLVGQRFPGRGAGGNDRVLSAVRGFGGLHLMCPRLADAQPAVGGNDVGVCPLRPRRSDGPARGNLVHVHQLFRLGSAAEQRDQGIMKGHQPILPPVHRDRAMFTAGGTPASGHRRIVADGSRNPQSRGWNITTLASDSQPRYR